MTYYEELVKNGVPKKIDPEGFTFEDVFDEYIADTPKIWSHDRNKSVGASEAFGCIRKTWFAKRGKEFGYEEDADYKESWGAMRRGDLIENHHVVPAIVSGLRRRGLDLIMAGEDQDTLVHGTSSATVDGLIINAPSDFLAYYGVPDIGSSEVIFEIKSNDPRISLPHAKDIHVGQTQMQMGIIRETTEYRPNYAVILYVNASWLDDMNIFVVPFDDSDYNIGLQRGATVFSTDKPELLHAEGKLDNECQYCKFQLACSDVSEARVPSKRKALTKKEVETQDTELVNELTPLVLERAELKAAEKTLKADIELANEKIKMLMVESNESRAVGDGWKTSYTFVAGAKRISEAKLEEAGLDPEDFKEKGAGFEKLTVTVAKDKD